MVWHLCSPRSVSNASLLLIETLGQTDEIWIEIYVTYKMSAFSLTSSVLGPLVSIGYLNSLYTLLCKLSHDLHVIALYSTWCELHSQTRLLYTRFAFCRKWWLIAASRFVLSFMDTALAMRPSYILHSRHRLGTNEITWDCRKCIMLGQE